MGNVLINEFMKKLDSSYKYKTKSERDNILNHLNLIAKIKQCKIPVVNQRSELLLDYTKQLKKQGTLASGQNENKLVKKYLANNCG